MRKTKIIATLGPATASYGKICALIKAGVSVFRLNFSHGDYKSFTGMIARIKKARKSLGVPVAIMQDLQGPKIRVENLKGRLNVKRGDKVVIRNPKSAIRNNSVAIDFKNLYRYVKPGQRILINDGMVQLKVEKTAGTGILCSVTAGGIIESRKGVNLPGAMLPVPAMTAKDRKDLKFGLRNEVDIICLSFVRKAEDLKSLNSLIKKRINRPLIIAKIEKPEALKQIDKILDECDGAMIARGDLAVEAGYRSIPGAQKKIIQKANAKGRLAIVATQMLESMINNPFPERAEITDIYNAVLDGADTLMLSGETSVGRYPEKVVSVMSGIIKEAEKNLAGNNGGVPLIKGKNIFASLLSYAAVESARQLKGSVTAVRVRNTDDIRYVSDYRPARSVAALTDCEGLYNRLAIFKGIVPILIKGGPESSVVEIKKRFFDVLHVIYADFRGGKKIKGELLVF